MANDQSCQPCGCDLGAGHLCSYHQRLAAAVQQHQFPSPQETNDGQVPFLSAFSLVGQGGAPARATTLPEAATERKQFPVASGVLDYFPDAIVAISNLSWKGNNQHNPGKPLHWDRSKSADEADTMLRHFLQRGTLDTDGIRHSVKVAWRSLALLQKEIEEEQRAANKK